MSPWATGSATIDALIEAKEINRLRGAGSAADGFMARARQQLASAAQLVDSDPTTAYVVAYDAVKHAAMALLAEQDLRPTSTGGHVAIERALKAQFQGVFDGFGRMRRRRNDLDYPSGPDDFAEATEGKKALQSATEIVDQAQLILDRGILTIY